MKVNSFYLIVLFSIIVSCRNRTIKADYYFHKNFSGEVAIIYDCENAGETKTKDGRLQFIVPSSGVLFTNTAYKEGISDSRFFIENNVEGYDTLSRYNNQIIDTMLGKKYIYFERIFSLECGANPETHNVFFFNVGERMDLQDKRFLFEQHVTNLLCDHK